MRKLRSWFRKKRQPSDNKARKPAANKARQPTNEKEQVWPPSPR